MIPTVIPASLSPDDPLLIELFGAGVIGGEVAPEGYAAMRQTDNSLMRSNTTPLYYAKP